MFVVFDLDGTLALTEHREHFMKREPKDWRGFYAACVGDQPSLPVVKTAHALMKDGHRVEIWSGRSMEVAAETAQWLADHGMADVPIKMRPDGDHQPDTKLKAAWLEAANQTPDLVFEDRASMVAMWRSQGIVCCQVAPGDF
jgi:hypothetical protein